MKIRKPDHRKTLVVMLTICIVVLVCLPQLPYAPGHGSVTYRPLDNIRRQQILTTCSKLSMMEFAKFIRNLANQRDLAALQVIWESDCQFSHWAAGEAVGIMEAHQAVEFCRSLEKDPLTWEHAFASLGVHPKKDVICYVSEIVRSSTSARAKYLAYHICIRNRWGDLQAYAERDKESTEFLSFPNQPLDEITLGSTAMRYLEQCRNPGE